MELVRYYLISRGHISIYETEQKAREHAKQLEKIGYMVKILKSITIEPEEPTETFTLIYKT